MTNEIKKRVANLLFPNPLPTTTEIEQKYPPRNLLAGAMVTRIAPSPTGFVHPGTIFISMINERLAHDSRGIFFVRIEDTDKKREVEGASKLVFEALKRYDIPHDEGLDIDGNEHGAYGPYKQSERGPIYQTYVKSLYERGLAYPCFATSEELEAMRAEQEKEKIRPGYYGKWAKWRDRGDEEVLAALEAGQAFVMRFRSSGNFDNKIKVHDLILGERELSENDQDIVILKSDGLPTYHMAHVIDDHFMGTTHVIRGNEWLASLALHYQLFDTMGWTKPAFGHIFPIQKLDGGAKRKLSKRKDVEANAEYFHEQGYPEQAMIEYFLNLANSGFEDWRKANPDADNRGFHLSFERLASTSGPLFDFSKLDNISKEQIVRLSAAELYERVDAWAQEFDTDFQKILSRDKEYSLAILDIERSNTPQPRKDIGKWSDVKNEFSFFFDELWQLDKASAMELIGNLDEETIKLLATEFLKAYDPKDDRDAWFARLKDVAAACGFATDNKEYKSDPSRFKGNVADAAKILRVLLCGRTRTPDLCAVMRVMGRERIEKRLGIL